MLIIGIDPGLSGGVACLGRAGSGQRTEEKISTTAMPVCAHYTGKGNQIDVDKLLEFIHNCRGFNLSPTGRSNEPVFVYIERVGNMPRMRNGKKVVQGATSMFNFGDGFGIIRGALGAYHKLTGGTVISYVWPPTWQKALFAKTAKGTSKQKALSFVSRYYTGLNLLKSSRSKKPHEGIVDSLAILEYGRRQLFGEETKETK